MEEGRGVYRYILKTVGLDQQLSCIAYRMAGQAEKYLVGSLGGLGVVVIDEELIGL